MTLAGLRTIFDQGARTIKALRQRYGNHRNSHQTSPLHSELLNLEQLEAHARALAATQQTISFSGTIRPLRAALERHERTIAAAHRALSQDASKRREITPAGEWLLDNYYVAVDQIREIRQDLPRGYYDELPKLAGTLRVYTIARELIEHTDGRIDLEHLLRYILAYQSVTPLTIGELWAVAIMLRVGLIENLARLAELILAAGADRDAADQWADRLLAGDGERDLRYSPVLAELGQQRSELSSAFALRLLRRLRSYDGDHDVGALVGWLERQPMVPYNNIEALIHAEHQRQAANQVSIGNTITSMRTLSAVDWNAWFEQVSFVEQVLRRDPLGAYGRSTFATRDRYRHWVEVLARRSTTTELTVARHVVDLAQAALASGNQRQAHVGYYLVDAGRTTLESLLGYRPTPREMLERLVLRYPTATYLGALASTTAGIGGVGMRLLGVRPSPPSPRARARGRGGEGQPAPAWLYPLVYQVAAAVAKELVDRGVATLLKPRVLPRLDLRSGIPPELRTIVVIPTLLLTPDSVRGQLEALEVLALANADPQLHFALLSDFADAPQDTMPDDATLLTIARQGVERLNQRYGDDRFLLLHRRRVWNPRQGCWMGWERKRGKLEEFNQLLIGATNTTFDTQVGALAVLRHIRYVITLDADTQLPRDAGRALIGTLAHPLNQARLDPASGRVVEGYGILQPRIGVDLPSAIRSRFARIFAGNVGVDPYTTAVSDVYMDLSGEGIYAGKGIYDPQALRAALADRFPDNTLLSHDLIEGNYARAGLLSDVELLDGYPATYAAYAARQHRWVRGDWQIGAWLLPWVPSAHGLTRTVLPLIARFKIFDNLRRSLLPPATVALLAAGWLRSQNRRQALLHSGYALLPLALPALLDVGAALGDWRGWRNPQQQLQNLRAPLLRLLLNVALLPDQATANIDAIVRTLVRLVISRRNLLEWETAAQAQTRLRSSSGRVTRNTLPLVAGVGALALAGRKPAASWLAALPVVSHWLAAPGLARWLDQPLFAAPQPVAASDQQLLRQLSRSTWAYFEQFVTEEAHYLAPDNFQETPSPLIAYRTSPTNIGLQLLADLVAYDFGYIGLAELTSRSERVFATIAQLERYRGHLLNWYDTQTLQPLPPAYVSTVDSGNLAGMLLALRQGYLALRDQPIIGPAALAGLRDTLGLAEAALPTGSPAHSELAALADRLAETPTSVGDYRRLLSALVFQASRLVFEGTTAFWMQRFVAQAQSWLTDLALLDGAGSAPQPDTQPPPTLAELQHGQAQHNGSRQHAAARALLARHTAIAATAWQLAEGMDFGFLYDETRRLFTIGYSVSEGRRDNNFYDLLASEARLASFFAIGKGDVPQVHWFQLGRTLLESGSGNVLASWSGTMFEYLMPLLLMRSYPDTLLDATYHVAVARQIQYGRQQGVPWGVSESAFNVRDPAMNYQYRAFGVPGLGLKRGLGADLVIAPYASVLALPVQPEAAISNIKQLIEQGMAGRYGLYEAIDYTADRLPPGTTYTVVRSFMVHHQGMSLLALANLLHDNLFQRRFHSEPLVQATELLLQEKLAYATPLYQPEETAEARVVPLPAVPAIRQVTTPTTPIPYTHLLSNGHYSVMLTNAGGGYSSSGDLAVTRWRADTACDNWGSFCYIRDVRSSLIWSAAYQPTCHQPSEFQAIFGLEKVEYRQVVGGIETRMEVAVSPEDNAEVRRITLANHTAAPRELEVTSYAEVVLAGPAADAAHPAFLNLFVETEFVADHDTLLASRRPRAANASRPWLFHTVVVRGHSSGPTEYETDRAAFIGRGRSLADPQALHAPLGGGQGAVLDPVVSLRRRVRIVPGGSAQIVFTTGVTESREQALQLADKYHDSDAALRAFSMARTESQMELRHLNIAPDEAQRFQRLATSVFYLDAQKRAAPDVLRRNRKGQPGLWAYGISGDEPIIVVQVASGDDLSLVHELLQAHQYWRLKRLPVDLVIMNEDAGGYLQNVQDQIHSLIRSTGSSAWLNQRGGIFALRADNLPEDDRVLLATVARAILSTRRGSLGQHLRRREVVGEQETGRQETRDPRQETRDPRPDIIVNRQSSIINRQSSIVNRQSLHLRAGPGGFDTNGEFVIELAAGESTPAPWSNVVANEHFGFIVSERGAGYTWSENSRENRLTPWSNDPVRDLSGELLYLRDEASGNHWLAVPRASEAVALRVTHGFGYSSFSQGQHGIASELRLAVASDDPVKFYRLRLHNQASEARQLSLTLYVEWVLGVFREGMAPYVITRYDHERGVLLAHNPYNPEFGERVAFLACSLPVVSFTGDRVGFIGRNGDLAHPAAMGAASLNGRVGAGFEPCGALRCTVELAAGAEHEVVFLLGQAATVAETYALIERYRQPAQAAAAEQAARANWQQLLGQVQVHTPTPELDVLLNGWLLYQTLACRIWARSAFYQSGGAYGFRDQLQDVMALLHTAPDIARAQIVRAAARQFVEGDVQHWWHPPSGRGIRTRFSDDYLWLPFVTAHYLTVTGDSALLDEVITFIEGRPLAEGEAEYYDLPTVSWQRASLYQHGVRAIDLALGRMGPHGLPLIGAGDWNDGMNMVGHNGQGESIWVGWFLLMIVRQWADLAEAQAEPTRAARYREEAERLRAALETHAWDGDWYLRAFYDDGTPLGSATADECQIDSLPQSWALISGVGDPQRARQAMAAVEERLIDTELGLIKLFTPPFNHSAQDPGYIKGYVPGVRENGGQYTHAALWVIWAYTLLGDGAKAGALLTMINPVRHTQANSERYKVEPYMIAADVYAVPPHGGRGGWTWYTGSAGWLYRLGIEQVLGLRRAGARLQIDPCIPPEWPGFSASYRYGQTVYQIEVENPQGVARGVVSVRLDDKPCGENQLILHDDGGEHRVVVQLG